MPANPSSLGGTCKLFRFLSFWHLPSPGGIIPPTASLCSLLQSSSEGRHRVEHFTNSRLLAIGLYLWCGISSWSPIRIIRSAGRWQRAAKHCWAANTSAGRRESSAIFQYDPEGAFVASTWSVVETRDSTNGAHPTSITDFPMFQYFTAVERTTRPDWSGPCEQVHRLEPLAIPSVAITRYTGSQGITTNGAQEPGPLASQCCGTAAAAPRKI
ncbi:hypothetical protein QBC39DRAFT_40444 [Podospora conica]|nr:hypothetical protein QBC39DRAFT_40444 [Schizothecium conicum]